MRIGMRINRVNCWESTARPNAAPAANHRSRSTNATPANASPVARRSSGWKYCKRGMYTVGRQATSAIAAISRRVPLMASAFTIDTTPASNTSQPR